MKQIKINCKEVLKALLDKTKTKDIRKAYVNNETYVGDELANKIKDGSITKYKTLENPSKYKVGDVCEVIWTGEPLIFGNEDRFPNGVIGKVKITSVEKIEINVDDYGFMHFSKRYRHSNGRDMIYIYSNKELSKSKGFQSVNIMFKFLENYLNLNNSSNAKPCWLISWEWIE